MIKEIQPTEKQLTFADWIANTTGIPYPESHKYDMSAYIQTYAKLAYMKEYSNLPIEVISWLSDNLNDKQGLYAFLCNGKVVYIGKSTNLGNRIASSYQERCWKCEIDEIRYYLMNNEADMNISELVLINKYKPLLNTDCNCHDTSTLYKTDIEVIDFSIVPFSEIAGDLIFNKWWSDERNTRKLLGLPTSKPLIYYPYPYIKNHIKNVIGFRIVDKYMPSSSYSLEVKLENGEIKRILAAHFLEMQSSSFVKNMEQAAQ